MKLRQLIIGLSIISATAFTSCQDNNRQNQNEVENNIEPETELRADDTQGQNNSVRLAVKENPELSTFALRMDAAEIAQSLQNSEGPFTIFAPNNAAYSYLYREHGQDVLLEVEKDEEIPFLIAEGRYTADSLRSGIEENNGTFTIPSMQGEHLIVSMRNDSIYVRGRAGNGASIIESDTNASNGVVHIISSVILPGDIETNVRLNAENNNNR